MTFEYVTIFLLVLISIILIFLLIKSSKAKDINEDIEINNIKEQLKSSS